jgi:hypothetical protein
MESQSTAASRSRKQSGCLVSVPPFVPAQAGTNEIAYEDIMINAAEYRAMASEHHRLAGMCRSPESREQHFRLEKDFLALAASEECLRGTRAAQHPSHSESADSMHCASLGYDTAHLAHSRY